MKRLKLIERLETIQTNIEFYDSKLAAPMPEYYNVFGTQNRYQHDVSIWEKSRKFWIRKFNYTLTKLHYNGQ